MPLSRRKENAESLRIFMKIWCQSVLSEPRASSFSTFVQRGNAGVRRSTYSARESFRAHCPLKTYVQSRRTLRCRNYVRRDQRSRIRLAGAVRDTRIVSLDRCKRPDCGRVCRVGFGRHFADTANHCGRELAIRQRRIPCTARLPTLLRPSTFEGSRG